MTELKKLLPFEYKTEKISLRGIDRLILPVHDYDASAANHPAGPNHYGFTNPHVCLLMNYVDGHAYAALRKDFFIGLGPKKLEGLREEGRNRFFNDFADTATERGWKSIADLCDEMPFEEALRIAEERARADNILLYDDRSIGCNLVYNDPRRMLWVPENWRAEVG